MLGSSVTQLRADDPEGEPLTYGVVGDEAQRYFSVDRLTGVVWLRQVLDREEITESVSILIGDINDNTPTFHGLPYTVHIPEFPVNPHNDGAPHSCDLITWVTSGDPQNTAVGTSVFMVNATDRDQGTGGSVLFYFQPPSPFFIIDGARGIVTVNRTLDYETTSAYQLTINATDQDKLRPLSRLTNLAILITDIQDMNPVFTNLPYSTNIAEDKSPVGTPTHTCCTSASTSLSLFFFLWCLISAATSLRLLPILPYLYYFFCLPPISHLTHQVDYVMST
ncbi:hypothetical protein NHX12_022792 [Muraenolepis orangiensis]|uniref:Cadherin domain-containing protein n=1 Tax=Muraenolepis orangiensis TaxID=630683 RepID=A0A9Q0ESG5_9TELE|nr:hypothetical protein NHX12_022792 [Muraenolepis orangiensis]